MPQLLTKIFMHIASIASVLGLYLSIFPTDTDKISSLQIFLIFVLILVSFLLFTFEIYSYKKNSPRVFTNSEKINKFMRGWITSNGRVVILSRDLSWAGDAETKSALENKARNNELTICLEKKTELSQALKNLGATIITYSELGHIPKSRFTIVDYERDGARVAVGVKDGDKHSIQIFRSGSQAFFAVTEDLIKFLIGYDRVKNAPKNHKR